MNRLVHAFTNWLGSDSSRRQHIAIFCLALAVTPFFRGGIDPLGLLFVSAMTFFAVLSVDVDVRRRLAILNRQVYLAAGLFLGWNWLSLLWTADRYGGLLNSLYLTVAAGVGLASLLILDSRRRQALFVRETMLLGAIICTIGIVMYMTSPFDRAASLFFWPNPLALYASILLLFAFWQYRSSNHIFSRLLFVLFATVFLLTQSVASFVYLSIICIVVAAVIKITWRDTKLLLSLIVVSLIAATSLSLMKTELFNGGNIGTPDQLSELVTAKSSGVSDRFAYWQGTIDIWYKRPLIGTGAGSFAVEYPSVQESADVGVQNPHNAFLQWTAELGIVGLALIVWLIALVMWPRHLTREIDIIVYGLAAMWLLHAAFYQTDRYPVLLAWLFIFVFWLSRERKQLKLPRWFMPSFSSALFGLILVSLSLFMSTAYGEAARSRFDEGRFAPAREMYEAANRQIVSDPNYLSESAWLAYLLNEDKQSDRLLQQAIDRDPSDAVHYYLQGLIANQRGQSQLAETALAKSLELDPLNIPRTYVVYADVLITQNRLDEAREKLDYILAEYTDETIKDRSALKDLTLDVSLLHWQRARVAYAGGEASELFRQLQRTLELNPGYPPAVSLQEKIMQQ